MTRADDKVFRLINQLQETNDFDDAQLAAALGVDEQTLLSIKNGALVPFHAGVLACHYLDLSFDREAMLDLIGWGEVPQPKTNVNFLNQLDLLKSRRNWSDAELALQIGLADRQHLAKIRTGERPIPFEVKVRAWDLLGYVISRDSILGLLPEKFSQRLKAVDNKRNRKGNLVET